MTNSDSTGVTASISDGRFLWLQFPNDSNEVPDASTVTVTASSTNTEVDGLTQTITVWVKDKTGNDLHFDEDSYSWTEDTTGNRIGVKLGWWPGEGETANLGPLASINDGVATREGSGALVFNYANWNEYQYVTYKTPHLDSDTDDYTFDDLWSSTTFTTGDSTVSRTYSGSPSITVTNIDAKPCPAVPATPQFNEVTTAYSDIFGWGVVLKFSGGTDGDDQVEANSRCRDNFVLTRHNDTTDTAVAGEITVGPNDDDTWPDMSTYTDYSLTWGSTYTFTLVAKNHVGTSTSVTHSVTVPAKAPGGS